MTSNNNDSVLLMMQSIIEEEKMKYESCHFYSALRELIELERKNVSGVKVNRINDLYDSVVTNYLNKHLESAGDT